MTVDRWHPTQARGRPAWFGAHTHRTQRHPGRRRCLRGGRRLADRCSRHGGRGDRAAERRGRRWRGGRGRERRRRERRRRAGRSRPRRGRPGTGRAHAERSAVERHLDRPVRVRSIGPPGQLAEPFEGVGRRVAVRVPGARRDDRDPGPDRLEELARRRGPRAVMRDLQQVDRRKASGDELRIDPFLDVPREQEAVATDFAEKDDRDVVDRGPTVERLFRDPHGIRPEHL
jgi:hypothetical protein